VEMSIRVERRLKVIEGGVGAGKTTLMNSLFNSEAEGLNANKWKVFREPGGTGFGDLMREAVQGNHGLEVTPYAALYAYAASRANLVKLEVIPALEQGFNVLLDRYWFSTYAYQGAEGVSKPIIFALNMVATGGLLPGKVLHIDLMPELGMARKAGCGTEIDRYDLKELEFHRKVRKNYLELAKIFPGIWHKIDATQSPDQVLHEAWKYLLK